MRSGTRLAVVLECLQPARSCYSPAQATLHFALRRLCFLLCRLRFTLKHFHPLQGRLRPVPKLFCSLKNCHSLASEYLRPALVRLRCARGQMSVELAVTIPVVMAVAAIVINTMIYLDVSARFDRLAAEAVRIEAASPGYGAYGTDARVGRVRALLQEQFAHEARFVRIEVRAYAGPDLGGDELDSSATTFSLIPQLETYECTLRYSPWGFSESFFGINFLEMSHTRTFTIDPFRPAVIG